MKKQILPDGYDMDRIRSIAEHYENQTDEEAEQELDAAFSDPGTTFIQVPTDLVSNIYAFIDDVKSGSGPVPSH